MSDQQQYDAYYSSPATSNQPTDFSNIEPVFRINSGNSATSTTNSNDKQNVPQPNYQQQQVPSSEPSFQTVNFQIRRPQTQQTTTSNTQQPSFSLTDKTKVNIQRQQLWNQIPTTVVEQLHAPKAQTQSSQAILSNRAKNYECVLPDSTIQYLIRRHGGEATDDITARVVGIIAEKFAVDLLSDANTLARSRGLDQINRTTKERRLVLTKSLIREVAQERGIVFKN